MPAEYLPPREFIVECFDYDPATGTFRWKARPEHHFPSAAVCKMWTAQFANSPAFVHVTPDGYRRTELRFEGRRIRARACRVAFKITHGYEPEQVDHIDGDRANDAAANLRAATQQQNQFNRGGWSGRDLPKGVYLDGACLRAAIWLDGRSVKLGRFSSPGAAHEAYCRAAREHHGAFFNSGAA